MSPPRSPAGRDRWIMPAMVLVVTLVYWPAFGADWVRDDFLVVAFTRLLESPLSLFHQDHFHEPSANFRPLGYASLWLNQALFGNGYLSYALVEWLLHAGSTLALYRLIRVGVRSPALAALGALSFGLHPMAMGAALWSSDRFGHLATLFTLVALRAACDYRDTRRPGQLAVTLLAALAAMLSKELGLAVAAPLAALWLWPALRRQSPCWGGLLGLGGAVLGYFLWRWAVLGTPGSGMTGTATLTQVFGGGLAVWFGNLPGYLGTWPQLDTARKWMLAVAALILAGAVLAAPRRGFAASPPPRRGELLLTGFLLAVVPAVLQAPIALLNGMAFDAAMSAVEAAMQARLYYLSLAGIALLLAMLAAGAWEASSARVRPALLMAMVLLLAGLASAARDTVEAYRQRSVEIGRVAWAAVAAVDRANLPARHCRIFFLDVNHAPEWDKYVAMDYIVKALSADLGRVGHCLIHADYVTYFHFLPAGVAAAEGMGHLHDIPSARGPARLRRVGGAEIAYFAYPEAARADVAPGTLFLAYRDGRFEDVSADVLGGRRAISFRP